MYFLKLSIFLMILTCGYCSVAHSCKPANCKVKRSYVAGSTKADFLRAFVLCKEFGMELASINSAEEETALEAYMDTVNKVAGPYEAFWLSGTRWGAGGIDFVWLTTGKPLNYRKFGQGQPDNAGGKEPCVEFVYNWGSKYLWNDIGCSHNLRFICQKDETICD